MWKVLLVCTFGVTAASSQVVWSSRARLVDPVNFLHKVVQATIFEVEERGVCNFKIDDIHNTLNEQMYKWHVNGTVAFTNGFLISVQKIDLNQAISGSISTSNQNITTATVRGVLNLRDVRVGFDVIANLTNEGLQRYTAVHIYTLMEFNCAVMKNLNIREITSSVSLSTVRGESNLRMIFMPSNSTTEVLSRRYVISSIWDSVRNWGTEMSTIMLEQAMKIGFPEICYNC